MHPRGNPFFICIFGHSHVLATEIPEVSTGMAWHVSISPLHSPSRAWFVRRGSQVTIQLRPDGIVPLLVRIIPTEGRWPKPQDTNVEIGNVSCSRFGSRLNSQFPSSANIHIYIKFIYVQAEHSIGREMLIYFSYQVFRWLARGWQNHWPNRWG